MQPHITGRHDAVQRAQVARVTEHQRRRQQALVQQALRPIAVGQHGLEQAGALGDAGLDHLPVGRLDQQRQHAQRPRPLDALADAGRLVDVVGHAVAVDLLRDLAGAPVQAAQSVGAQQLEEVLPALAQRLTGVLQQFVVVARIGPPRGVQHAVQHRIGMPAAGSVEFERRLLHGGGIETQRWRRSRVKGNSRLGWAGWTFILPGV